MAESEKSVTWVITAAMLFLAVAGWGFLAGSYTGAHATPLMEMTLEQRESLDSRSTSAERRQFKSRAEASFIWNAVEQLPNFFGVMSWHFKNRIWLPIVIVVLEVLVFFGGIKMKALEKELSK